MWHCYHLLFNILKNSSCVCIAFILVLVHCAWRNHTGRKARNNRAFTERSMPISLSLWFTNLRTITANSYRPYWARDGHVVSSIIHHPLPQTSVQFCPLILHSVHILFINFFTIQFYVLLVLSISVADLIITRNNTCKMDILAVKRFQFKIIKL